MSNNWEIIDENLENFDVFNNDFSVDINNEINKYQGLMSFARYVEQNEPKPNMNQSWMFSLFKPNTSLNTLNSPLKKKMNRSNLNLNFSCALEEEKTAKRNTSSPSLDTLGKSTYYKTNNFNILFPPRFVTRRNSDELTYYHQKDLEFQLKKKKKKNHLKRKNSFQNLPTFNNLMFLDQITHEYMSKPDFNETKAEHLRQMKRIIQDIFKAEQEQNEEFIESSLIKNNNNFIKPRKVGPWGEIWEDLAKNISQTSPYGHFPSYQVRTLIVKGGDDLRQELIAMQLMMQINKIFKKAELNIYLRPYDIIVTSANSGIIGS